MRTIIRIITLVLMLIYMANLEACAENSSSLNKPKARTSHYKKGKFKKRANSYANNVKNYNRCDMMGKRNKATVVYL